MVVGRKHTTEDVMDDNTDIRVTIRLTHTEYDALVNAAQRERLRAKGEWGYKGVGALIRKAITHYLACPEGIDKDEARLTAVLQQLCEDWAAINHRAAGR
jgi:hypothetical protein